MTPDPNSERGIQFHRPVAFWLGATALSAGVLMHLPFTPGVGSPPPYYDAGVGAPPPVLRYNTRGGRRG
jgi:hypothetical protein